VTPLPGTTRDTLEEAFAIEGIPIRLVDTAGIRGGGALLDEAEAMGVERSREAMADADVVLFVHDATLPVSADERQIAAAMSGRPSILLYNKADLLEPGSHGKPELTTEEERSRRNHDFSGNEPIYTSAVTGEGVAELRAALLKKLLGEADSAGAALNNERQRQAVAEALGRLGAASEANAARLPHELLLVDLHEALTALDSLTGETTTEDILGRIFSSFCIGK
jgi:tRNA modification GTPase